MLTAAKTFITSLTPRAYLLAGIVAAIGLALLLTYCTGRSDGRKGADLARAEANVEALATASATAEQAAEERAADKKIIADKRKELTDACQAYPAGSDDRRVCRGCERLRAQGTDTRRVAACGRFERPAPAKLPR